MEYIIEPSFRESQGCRKSKSEIKLGSSSLLVNEINLVGHNLHLRMPSCH